MSDSSTTAQPLLRLAPTTMVVLRAEGFTIPNRPGAPPLSLELPHLGVLAALAEADPAPVDRIVDDVAAHSDCSTDELRTFVQVLRRRGHAVDHSVPAARPLLHDDTPATNALWRSSGPDGSWPRVLTPLTARLADGRYELLDHDGRQGALLGAAEVFALASLTAAGPLDAAYQAHREAAGPMAIDRARFADLVAQLQLMGLVEWVPPRETEAGYEPRAGLALDLIIDDETARSVAVFRRRATEHEAAERDREARTGTRRPKVVPVAFDPGPPLGLGMIVAFAKAFREGILDDHYDFRLDWVFDEERIPSYTETPSVFLFSNYLWSHRQCVDVSERVKALSPGSVTVHGGPDTPKYEGDAEAYFRAFPHVDVTVRGEGEIATAEILDALRPVLGSERPDLSLLADVPGISYRDGDRVVRTPDRERIADLDIVPSPFLTGLFDAYAEIGGARVTIETNRGCPYGCTFCDWGSATLSRMRKFSLDRVFAELEWCARAKALVIGPADSNFGIFERDVEIAERIAELKGIHGYPQAFGVSFAKNTVKHLRHIIQVMAGAGIMTQGILSLQSMDEATLDAVHRSNIKTEKYDELANEFRRSDLPLFVDLMLGLPGSTPESFVSDLQACVDREVQVRIPRTTLLVNSPMNDPDYRAEYRIETNTAPGPGKLPLVVSTSTFSREEYQEMTRLRLAFILFENFGALRQVSRYVRQEAGLPEVELYRRLLTDTAADPDRWPALYLTAAVVPQTMCPPASWALVLDELHEYLVEEIGVADDDALATVLSVQHALLPAHARPMPQVLDLRHDFAAWSAAVVAVKEGPDRTRWTELVPPLRQFPPERFVVDDPGGAISSTLGCDIEMHGFGLNWEFESPVRRAMAAQSRPREPLPVV